MLHTKLSSVLTPTCLWNGSGLQFTISIDLTSYVNEHVGISSNSQPCQWYGCTSTLQHNRHLHLHANPGEDAETETRQRKRKHVDMDFSSETKPCHKKRKVLKNTDMNFDRNKLCKLQEMLCKFAEHLFRLKVLRKI